jgi:ribose transport system substrate-binding protein
MRTLTTLLLALLLTAALAQTPPPTVADILRGTGAPLTLTVKDLGPGWLVFTPSGLRPAVQDFLLYSGAPGYKEMTPAPGYVTRGQVVALNGRTYLLAYMLQDPGMSMAPEDKGLDLPLPISADTPLYAALLDLASAGNLLDITPYSLDWIAEVNRVQDLHRQQALATASINNLKQMVLALMAYAQDNSETLPSEMGTTALWSILRLSNIDNIIHVPGTHTEYMSNANLAGRSLGDPTIKDPTRCVAFYEPTARADGKRGVAFLDGHVEMVSEAEWVTLKASNKLREPLPPGARTLKIAMIAKSSTNPVFLSAWQGAKDAAKKLGEANGVNITIDWMTPPVEDGQVQAEKIALAVAQKDDAIILSCSDPAKVKDAINDAVAAGVPVMIFDSDCPQSNRFAFYGVDDVAAGRQVMDELAKLMGGKGKIAILTGNPNAPNLQNRALGVEQEAKAKYPNIKILGRVYFPETAQDATAKIQEYMAAHPELTGWAMVAGWPLFSTTLLTDKHFAKVKTVAVDALPVELAYVDKGLVPTLLAQPTYQWGYVSVEKIIDKLILNKDVPVINTMELTPVRKDNLKQWAQQLKDWGFTGPSDLTELNKYLKP